MTAETTEMLKATISPSGVVNKKVTWSSGNSSVAAVSSSGKVSAKAPGKAVITARTSNGKTAKCTVTAVPKGTPITKRLSQRKRWLNIQYRANPNANGCQIQYGTSLNMKGAKYYVRVRTFNIVNGKRIYSDWSGIKSMRVK